MMMAVISPLSGAPEQQDLIPSERIRSSATATASDNSGKIRASFFGEDEGVDKKPHARGCSRVQLVGPTRPGTWTAWDHPIWPSWPSYLRPSFLHPSLDEKLAWYFSFNYLGLRNSRNNKSKKRGVFCLPDIKCQKNRDFV